MLPVLTYMLHDVSFFYDIETRSNICLLKTQDILSKQVRKCINFRMRACLYMSMSSYDVFFAISARPWEAAVATGLEGIRLKLDSAIQATMAEADAGKFAGAEVGAYTRPLFSST